MVAVANRDGYAHASVSAVIAEAGVSRPTFYEYFSDRDDCFLAALTDAQVLAAGHVGHAVAGRPAGEALAATLGALVGLAATAPAQARFLMSEAMAAGPAALGARDEGIEELAQLVDATLARAGPGEQSADVCPRSAIGGAYRLLAARLRRGEPGLARLAGELEAWLESYRLPAREQRWRALTAISGVAELDGDARGPLPLPAPLPPGRPRAQEVVAENHRQRILHAAATLAETQGYNATTIADITRVAGVDARAFYALFGDKQDAFMAVHELGVEQVMAATAGAFFAGASWPERIWKGALAFTAFLERNPLLTQVGFVEAYAVGPGAVRRVEDSHVTFTIFLQEGYQHDRGAGGPSRLALEAIITTVFEIVYRRARGPAQPEISGMLPHIAFLALAPFLGAAEANEFIGAQLAAIAAHA
jgi:AcrR family transcriptional regulator